MIKLTLISFLSLYTITASTWIFYLAFMNLKRNKDKIHPIIRNLFIPLYVIALLLDVLFNITVGSLMFLERPKEWLFTSRCERHKAESKGWRLRNATLTCAYMLNPFEPSIDGHC